uniref:L antigen family member 3 n=1 Tax=Culicoides sonorensis TaxID=179676 RepID=A0A336LXL9_CULSO
MTNTVVEFSIPFPDKRTAEIVYDVIRIDPEPKRNQVDKIINLEENILKVKVTSKQPKVARVVVNSIFEAIILSTETINQFGPITSGSYDHY